MNEACLAEAGAKITPKKLLPPAQVPRGLAKKIARFTGGENHY
jgi:hypothetical protein